MGKKLYKEQASGIVINSERKKGWFSIPNYIYDLWLPVIGSDTIGVYTTYCRVEMHGGVRKISLRSLAAACRIGAGKLNKINAKLERCGFIKVNKPKGYHRLMHWTTEIVMLDPPQAVTKELIDEFCLKGEYEPLTKWLFEEDDATDTPNSAPLHTNQAPITTPNNAPKIEDLDNENIEEIEFSDLRSEHPPQSSSISPTLSPTPESPIPIQEAAAVSPREPDESLTTRTAPDPGDPFYLCEEPMLEAQFVSGDTHEGMVDKSGIPVSDAAKRALRDVMSTPVGSDSPSPDGSPPLDSAACGLIDMNAPSVYTANPQPGPADDNPKYEVPSRPVGERIFDGMVNNVAAAICSPDGQDVIIIPPVQAKSYAHERVQDELVLLERKKADIEQLTKKQISTLAYELEAYFCEIAGLKAPNRSTAYFAKKAHIRWGNPCKEMMRLADYGLTKAKRFMDAAWAEVVKDSWQGKISTAQSIENYFGAQARGKGKAVPMPSSAVLGLTDAQKNTGLFSRQKRNGKK